MEREHRPDLNQRRASKGNWVLIGFVATAAFFLFTEHRAHVFGALPYLLLLACPLMHVFMHRGHGRQQGEDTTQSRQDLLDKQGHIREPLIKSIAAREGLDQRFLR